MINEQIANEIYWAMEHGDLRKADSILEKLATSNSMKTQKLELLSMEDLSRLIKNEGEDRMLREGAARELAKRENNLYHRSTVARPVRALDYLY